jgi:hypothetical protein
MCNIASNDVDGVVSDLEGDFDEKHIFFRCKLENVSNSR